MLFVGSGWCIFECSLYDSFKSLCLKTFHNKMLENINACLSYAYVKVSHIMLGLACSAGVCLLFYDL